MCYRNWRRYLRVLELPAGSTNLSGNDLATQRHTLPDQPGVYLFRNRAGRVIYVGKANSIRKRVASHFGAGGNAT